MLLLRQVLLLPAILSCGYLIAIVFNERVHDAFNTSPFVYGPLALALFMPVCFAVAAAIARSRKQELWRAALLSVCAVAPFAVFYPWVIIPGKIGLATGDFLFFLGWLTRYPNLGPLNVEVFLGICCVILASFLPALFAYCSMGAVPRRKRSKTSLGILLVDVIVTIPLFANLDRSLLLFWVFGYTWLDGETHIRNVFLAIGPLLRLIALAIAVLVMLKPPINAKGIDLERSNNA